MREMKYVTPYYSPQSTVRKDALIHCAAGTYLGENQCGQMLRRMAHKMTDPTPKIYKTTITLTNWTDAEINTISQINPNWHMTGQVYKRGNDD